MKKVFFTALAMTFAIASFTGCKDNGTTPPDRFIVTPTNVAGETEGVTEIKALYYTEFDLNTFLPTAAIPEANILAVAPFANGGSTLALPLTLAGNGFRDVTQASFPEGITLSAPFKTLFISFQAYKETELTGVLTHQNAGGNVLAYLIYSDTAVTITGGATNGANGAEYVLNATIAAGWNWIYIGTETIAESVEGEVIVPPHPKYTIQTTAFAGATLIWNYHNIIV